MKDTQLKNIGIIGYPLGHSLSPGMHNYLYKSLAINAHYNKWEISELNLKNEFIRITNENFIGANVTVPYKEKIIPFLDELDSDSKITGAVNTILKQNGKLLGFNTDIYGIRECLNKKFSDEDIDNVVLLGSGGAAKAVMYVLLQRGLKNISIINRTKLNTNQMLDNFKNYKFNSEYLDFDDKDKINQKCMESNLIINTTTIGMKGSSMEGISPLDIKSINNKNVVFDLVYNPRITKLVEIANNKNAEIIEGIDMLVYQAIRSIEIWTEITPSFDIMKNKCLELLK
tara:strand:+ start:114 stop:971 length:858 start_codon:yes stop_codon:yes gene_type:complete